MGAAIVGGRADLAAGVSDERFPEGSSDPFCSLALRSDSVLANFVCRRGKLNGDQWAVLAAPWSGNTRHESPLTTHESRQITNHKSPLTNHQSPMLKDITHEMETVLDQAAI